MTKKRKMAADDPTIVGKTVLVYRNLHRDQWSVVDAKTGQVVLHASWVILSDAVLVVSRAGRERAVLDGQRNVHARVRGVLMASGGHTATGSPDKAGWLRPGPSGQSCLPDWRRVTYNPFRLPFFHLAGTSTQVTAADRAFFDHTGALWCAGQAHVATSKGL